MSMEARIIARLTISGTSCVDGQESQVNEDKEKSLGTSVGYLDEGRSGEMRGEIWLQSSEKRFEMGQAE